MAPCHAPRLRTAPRSSAPVTRPRSICQFRPVQAVATSLWRSLGFRRRGGRTPRFEFNVMTDMTELSLEFRLREEPETRERPGRAEGAPANIASLNADEAPELAESDAVDVVVTTTARAPVRARRDEPRSPDLIATYFRQMGRAEMITREQE